MKRVTFTKLYEYDIDTDDNNTAHELAYEMFKSDMLCSVGDTSYDCCEINNIDEDEEDDYE